MKNEGRAFAGVCALLFFGVSWLVVTGYRSIAAEQAKWAAERKAHIERIHKCIDAGGYPVTVETYVKGVGEGHVCIKSVEVIVE